MENAEGEDEMKVITDCFTERDGTSWCLLRIAAMPILASMTYKFIISGSPDYQAFAIGIAAIFASIGFKNITERDK